MNVGGLFPLVGVPSDQLGMGSLIQLICVGIFFFFFLFLFGGALIGLG